MCSICFTIVCISFVFASLFYTYFLFIIYLLGFFNDDTPCFCQGSTALMEPSRSNDENKNTFPIFSSPTWNECL
jgi:hypothetical protein